MADEPTEFQVQATWVIDPSVQPSPVNQVLIQSGIAGGSGEFSTDVYMRFGNANPPVFVGVDGNVSPDTIASTVLSIYPQAYVQLNVERFREIHGKMGEFLEQLDAAKTQK